VGCEDKREICLGAEYSNIGLCVIKKHIDGDWRRNSYVTAFREGLRLVRQCIGGSQGDYVKSLCSNIRKQMKDEV
jgi:hypothetical protein